jgi:hypothetical protein
MLVTQLVIGIGMSYMGLSALATNNSYELIGFGILTILFNFQNIYLYLIATIPGLQSLTASKNASKLVFNLHWAITSILGTLHILTCIAYWLLLPTAYK